LAGQRICRGVVTCCLLSHGMMHSAYTQDDILERTDEVERIRMIFQRAKRVIIWLGTPMMAAHSP
jgi:hypothetical protein